MRPLVVDALAAGKGKRKTTLDVIGAGPRTICGVLEIKGMNPYLTRAEVVLSGDFLFDDFNTLLISGMANDSTAIRKVISLWKSWDRGPVIVGGPISSEHFRVLYRTGADIAVIGEGEETLVELLNAGIKIGKLPSKEKLQKIKGISFKKDSEIQVNSLRASLSRKKYNTYIPSTRVISDYAIHYATRVYVEILRGCSNYRRATVGRIGELCDDCGKCRDAILGERYYCHRGIPPGCGYCSVPSLFGPPKSRAKSNILMEIQQLLEKGVSRFVLSAPGFLDYGRDYLVDPEPLTDPRHPEPNYAVIEDLLSSIFSLAKFKKKQASVLIENMKASLLTEKAVEILGKYLSGSPVSIGLETGSEKHSRVLGRHSTPKEVLKAVKRLSDAGIRPYVYVIYGLPGQSQETVDMTIKAIEQSMENGAERIILYRFQSLPMSCFSQDPSAASSKKNPHSKQIFESARKANSMAKRRLMSKKIQVIISEKYSRDKRYNVAYPLLHGPVVLVKNAEKLVGAIVEVKIEKIKSNRIIEGTLIR